MNNAELNLSFQGSNKVSEVRLNIIDSNLENIKSLFEDDRYLISCCVEEEVSIVEDIGNILNKIIEFFSKLRFLSPG